MHEPSAAAAEGPGRPGRQQERHSRQLLVVSPFSTPPPPPLPPAAGKEEQEDGKGGGGGPIPGVIINRRHDGAGDLPRIPSYSPKRSWAEASEAEAEVEVGNHVGTVLTIISGGRGPFARHYANNGSPMGLLSDGGSHCSSSSDGAGTSAYMTAADKYDNTNIGILPPLPFPLLVPPGGGAPGDGAPGSGSAVHGLGRLIGDGDVGALPDTASIAAGGSGRLMAAVAAGGGLGSNGHVGVVGGAKESCWETEQLGHDQHHYLHPFQCHPRHSQSPLTPSLRENQGAQRHFHSPGLPQSEDEPCGIDPWVSRKNKAQEVDPSWRTTQLAKTNDDTSANANAVVQQVVLGRGGDVSVAVVADATVGSGGAAILSLADLPRLSLRPLLPPPSLPAQAQQPARRRPWGSDRPTGHTRKMEKPYDLGPMNESTGTAATADMTTARLRHGYNEHQRGGSPGPPSGSGDDQGTGIGPYTVRQFWPLLLRPHPSVPSSTGIDRGGDGGGSSDRDVARKFGRCCTARDVAGSVTGGAGAANLAVAYDNCDSGDGAGNDGDGHTLGGATARSNGVNGGVGGSSGYASDTGMSSSGSSAVHSLYMADVQYPNPQRQHIQAPSSRQTLLQAPPPPPQHELQLQRGLPALAGQRQRRSHRRCLSHAAPGRAPRHRGIGRPAGGTMETVPSAEVVNLPAAAGDDGPGQQAAAAAAVKATAEGGEEEEADEAEGAEGVTVGAPADMEVDQTAIAVFDDLMETTDFTDDPQRPTRPLREGHWLSRAATARGRRLGGGGDGGSRGLESRYWPATAAAAAAASPPLQQLLPPLQVLLPLPLLQPQLLAAGSGFSTEARRRRRPLSAADDFDAGVAATGGDGAGRSGGNPLLKRRRRCVWDERAALAANAAVINGTLSQYVRTMSLNPPPPSSTEQRLPLPHWRYRSTLPFLSLPGSPPSLPLATAITTTTAPIASPAPPHQYQHQHPNPPYVAVPPTPTANTSNTATTSNLIGWRPAVAPNGSDVYDGTATNPMGFPLAPEQHRVHPQWITSAPMMSAGLSFPPVLPSFPYCDMSLQPALMAAAATASTGAAAALQAQLATDICGGCYAGEWAAPAITASSAVAATAAAAAASATAAAAGRNTQADGADTSTVQQPVVPPLEYGGHLLIQRLGATRSHDLLHQHQHQQEQQQQEQQKQQQGEEDTYDDQRNHQRGAEWLRFRGAEVVGGWQGLTKRYEVDEGVKEEASPPCPGDLPPAQLGPIPPTEVLDSELLPSLAERRSQSIQPVGSRPTASSGRDGEGDWG